MGSPVLQVLPEPATSSRRRCAKKAWAGLLSRRFQKLCRYISPKLVFQRMEGEFELPKIEANQGAITQVNVFTISPENQQPLIDLLIEAANSVRDVPAWI